ncbi:YceI family protein [Rufibacter roseus]|uniref:YceI family protein n=1 Tax=Rufibacter roseus TaxID=1567108 RepID=A0ABW2DJA3_9BACT|nr:YceI family protein [Rufibacter roseus]
MKTARIFKMAWVLGLVFGLYLPLSAQSVFQLSGKPELKVIGSSTLHDWEMVASSATGKAEIALDNQQVASIKSAEVTMSATALKSGKGQMDEIAYKALKAEKNPTITFKFISYKSLGGNKGQVIGNLTIAGTTKPVTFEVQTVVRGTHIDLKGTTSFKMTDFKMVPPTAMFGTIKTGNEVKVEFKTTFSTTNS